jgi:hypothetical protein
MNGDNMPADQVEANQWQGMLRDWRALPAWEIVVTVLTLVMVRQHLGLAVAAAAHRPGRRGCGSRQRPLIARTRCAGSQQPDV